jgi:hypothetical protein
MSERILPRYPIYIPSKGRANHCYTARYLAAENTPFSLVVESQEAEEYAARFGSARILILPFSGRGLIGSRNWIKEHATAASFERHWQLDDNIRYFHRRYRGQRVYCDASIALRVCEDFTDRYENIAISGLNYYMFVPDDRRYLPLQVNCRVYSCSLVLNSLPFGWRLVYNDDTDICLQALANGWCTVLLNTFLAQKIWTMKTKGGNTDALYQGDGRLKMARSLERVWPGVVTIDRRFQRPQHIVKDDWKKFDTPLKLKPGIDLSQLLPNEYGMELVQVAPEVKSPRIQGLLDDWQKKRGDNAPISTQATEEAQATDSTQALQPTPQLTTSEEEP